MKSLVGIVLLCCIVAVYTIPISSRVVGGSNADDGKYPYQVVLRYGPMFLCSGSILNQHYILTAAHCVYKRKAQMITITTGTNDIRGDGGKFYFANDLIVHENFTSMDIEDIADDIALIRVEGEIEFNEKVQPIVLPTTDFDTYNSPAILTGWGRTDEAGANPKMLQEIELRVITQESCKNSWKQILDTHICTLTKVGEGACSGDSGGPLVSEGVQIGIVSFGKACAQGVPDVFTRVFSYLDWIKSHMTE